ncbi:MAG: iron donor protein CyaY [Pseudomonadota bacterium]
MTESEFNDVIDDILINIEEQLDDLDTDVDYETSSGILTLIMPNNSQIIINRQSANLQLWMAAKSGGYHFVYDNDQQQWIDTRSQESFTDSLNRCLNEQSGESFSLTLQKQ